ncbi:MAG: S8 family serine peptidase [Phycisphaerae bacterium]|nr:S8 family serine peptidase [Phycisphaerae bacterium]
MNLISWGCVVLALGASVADAQVESAFSPIPGVREHSGRLLVRPVQPAAWVERGLTPGQAQVRYEAARASLGPWRVSIIDVIDTHVVSVPEGLTELGWASELVRTGEYEFVEPDWLVSPAGIDPDDPFYRIQWHLQAIDAPSAWQFNTADGSIICAIVDTGADLTHPDLAPSLVPGFNSVTRTPQALGGQVSDVSGHGTAVAGTAGAVGNNALGGSGVGWGLKIMPVRASNFSSGSAFLSDILYGAIWAAANGCRVVNVSFAGVENQAAQATGAAITNNYGGLLFWAAGNSGTNLANFDWPDVVVVAGTTELGGRAPDSCWGRAVDLAAPGVGLYVTARGGGYGPVSGTSFASPIAAATAAMIWSSVPGSTPAQILGVLESTCTPVYTNVEWEALGAGIVNLGAAIRAVTPPPTVALGLTLNANGFPGEFQGIQATYYPAGNATTIPPITGSPVGAGMISQLDLAPGAWAGCPLHTNFVAHLEGSIWVPASAAYTFTVDSRDGANLYVGGRLIVNNDGLHPLRSRSGSVALDAGYHRFRVDYFTRSPDPTLKVRFRGAGLGEFILDRAELSFDPVSPPDPNTSRR